MKEKIGTCVDVVLVMKYILDKMNVQNKIWLLHQNVKKIPHTILTFEAEGKLVYLELTPQSNKPWYGKEILYESEQRFIESFQKDDFTIIEITDQIMMGAHPDSLLQHLPELCK